MTAVAAKLIPKQKFGQPTDDDCPAIQAMIAKLRKMLRTVRPVQEPMASAARNHIAANAVRRIAPGIPSERKAALIIPPIGAHPIDPSM